jgi:hypothetical protein
MIGLELLSLSFFGRGYFLLATVARQRERQHA